jgi:hypothetical protein
MRTLLFWLFWLLLCGLCLAAPVGWAASVSQDYLCIQGHEQEATTKLQNFIKDAVRVFFRRMRIALDPATLKVSVSSSVQPANGGTSYVAMTGTSSGGTSALAPTSIAATAAAKDGTKFNILFSSGEDTQDAAEYRVIGSQRGFDREGNAIGRHCALRLFDSGDMEATRTLLVVNAGSGHALGRIRLPASISVY